jgi:hypothetical protein
VHTGWTSLVLRSILLSVILKLDYLLIKKNSK